MNGKTKILITGATGYIGEDLLCILMDSNDKEISIVVRNMIKAKEMFGEKISYILYNKLEQFKKEVENFSPDIIVHLAAYSTSGDTQKDIEKLIESNVVFTSHLLGALSNCNIKLFINTGSFSEYHNSNDEVSPTYFYSATKTSARYMIEYFSKRDGFKFVNAILYSVYGKKSSNKKIIDYALESLNSSLSVGMSSGYQCLDFIHMDDVVNFYINLIDRYKELDLSKVSYEVGTGKCYSIREMVVILEKLTNKKANIEWGKYKIRKVDTVRACANIVNTREELKFISTVPLFEGLEKYIKDIEL